MRKLVLAAVLASLAIPAAPVFAQQQQGPSAEDIAAKRDKETLDRQYNNALKAGSAAAQTKSDPWAQMRTPAASAEQKR